MELAQVEVEEDAAISRINNCSKNGLLFHEGILRQQRVLHEMIHSSFFTDQVTERELNRLDNGDAPEG